MEFGRIVVLRKGNPGASYELDLGEHSIGSAEDCDLRLRLPNGNLLAKHAILKVSPNGVAIIINKSHQAPVTINAKSCLKSAVLKHGDIFEIIGKQFQYFNEKLKDEPENSELFVKERNNLLKSNKKSITPLIKPDVTYKTMSTSTPEKSLSTRRSVISHRRLSEINLVKGRKHSLQNQLLKFEVNTPKAKRRSSRVNSDIPPVQNNKKVCSTSSSHSSDGFSSVEPDCLQESIISTTNSDSENTNKEQQLADESIVSNNSSDLNNSDTNLQSISRTELDLDMSDFKPISHVTVRDRKRRVRSKSLTVQDIQVISPISTSHSKSLQDAHLSNENSKVLVTPSSIHDKSRVNIKEHDVSEVDISSSLFTTTNVSNTDSKLSINIDSLTSDTSKSEGAFNLVLSASLSPKGEQIISSEQDTFRNSAVLSINESTKPISIFDETTQEANHNHFENTFQEHYDELTSDNNAFGKRMSTFDESTQTANQNGNTFGNTTEEAPTLPNGNQSNGISAEDLSPVKALNSNGNSDILLSISARRSLRSSVLQSSSLTSSLVETTSPVLSVSSQSFSMFKRAYSPADDTEIDVVNFTAVSEPQSGLQVSTRSSKILVDAESPLKRTPEKRRIFDGGICTSTPFVKTGVTVQNVKKEVSMSVKRRSSLRLSTSKRERQCISCRSEPKQVRSFSLPRVSNVDNRKLHSRSVLLPNDSKVTPLRHQVISKRKNEEVCEITLEKSSDVTDETPKSHIKPARRLSKANTSTYNPVVEDITPVTPEVFLDSDPIEGPFKTPINTPGLFESIRESAIRSRKRGRESHGLILQEEKKFKGDFIQENTSSQEEPAKSTMAKRKRKSPQNRLSNFEGVKKLMKTPTKSPKNDLTNVPNLRSLMSPRVKRSPKNDLTSVRGVKKLLKSPKPTKDPSNDLTNITGVACLFDTSGVEPLHNDSDAENFEDLFTKLSGKVPIKSYNSRGKSLSPNKVEPTQHNGSSRKTMGDIPHCSPRVHQWVTEHAEMKAGQSLLPDDDIFNNMSTKPEQKHRLARSVSSKKRPTQRNSRRKTHGDTVKTTKANFDVIHVGTVEHVDDSDDEGQSETPAHSSKLSADSESKNDILEAKKFVSGSRLTQLGSQPKEATFKSHVERTLRFDSNTTSKRACSLSPNKAKTEKVNRRKSTIAFLNTQSNDAEELLAAENIDETVVLNTVSEQPLRTYGTRKSLADIEKAKAQVIIRQSFGGFSAVTSSGTFKRNKTSGANKSNVEENSSFKSGNDYNLVQSSTIDEAETAPEDIRKIRTTLQLNGDDNAIEEAKNETEKVVSTRRSSRRVAEPIAEADTVAENIGISESALQLKDDDKAIEEAKNETEKVVSTRRSSRRVAEPIAEADTVAENIGISESALQLKDDDKAIEEAKNETEKVVSTRRSSRRVAEPIAEADTVAENIGISESALQLKDDDKAIEEAKNETEKVVSTRRSSRRVAEPIAEADTVPEVIGISESALQLKGGDKAIEEAKNETEKVVSTRRSSRRVAAPIAEADTVAEDIGISESALQLKDDDKAIEEAKNETEKVVSTRRSSRRVAEPIAEADTVAEVIGISESALQLKGDDKAIEEAKNETEKVVSTRRSSRRVAAPIAEADTVAEVIGISESALQLKGDDKAIEEAKNETEKVVSTRRSSRRVAEPIAEADTVAEVIGISESALQLKGDDNAIEEAKNETEKVVSTRRSSRRVAEPIAEADTVAEVIGISESALKLKGDDNAIEEAKNETEKVVSTRRSSRRVAEPIAEADTVAEDIRISESELQLKGDDKAIENAKNETEKVVSTRRSSRKVAKAITEADTVAGDIGISESALQLVGDVKAIDEAKNNTEGMVLTRRSSRKAVESIDKAISAADEFELEQAGRALKVDTENENVRTRRPSKRVADVIDKTDTAVADTRKDQSSLQLLSNDKNIDGAKTSKVHTETSVNKALTRKSNRNVSNSIDPTVLRETRNSLDGLITSSAIKNADNECEVLEISEVTETKNKRIEKIPANKVSNKRRPQRAKKTATDPSDDTDLVGQEVLSRCNKLLVPIQDHMDPTIEKNQESGAPIPLRRGTRRRVILSTEDIDATAESILSSNQITEQEPNALMTVESKTTRPPKPVKTVKKSTRGKNKAIGAVIQSEVNSTSNVQLEVHDQFEVHKNQPVEAEMYSSPKNLNTRLNTRRANKIPKSTLLPTDSEASSLDVKEASEQNTPQVSEVPVGKSIRTRVRKVRHSAEPEDSTDTIQYAATVALQISLEESKKINTCSPEKLIQEEKHSRGKGKKRVFDSTSLSENQGDNKITTRNRRKNYVNDTEPGAAADTIQTSGQGVSQILNKDSPKVDDFNLKQPSEEKKSTRAKSQKKSSPIENQVEKKTPTRSRKEKSENESKEVVAEPQIKSEEVGSGSNARPVRSRKKPNNVKQITEEKDAEVEMIEQNNEEVIESRKPQSNRKRKNVHFEVEENQDGKSVEVGTQVKTTKRRNAVIAEPIQAVELEPVKKKGRSKKKDTEDNLPPLHQSPKNPRVSIVANRTRSRAQKV